MKTTPNSVLMASAFSLMLIISMVDFADAQSSRRPSYRPPGSGSGSRSNFRRAAPLGGQPEKTKPAGFAMLELFTSEGCSSCPPADANLARLNSHSSENRIYTLSYHVDYWNYLGWKDPYSDKKFTARQQEYARAFKSDKVYTPQMVINGAAEFNGSNDRIADQAVEIALKQTPQVGIFIESAIAEKSLTVRWKSAGLKSSDIITVVLVQNEGAQAVNAGENRNRDLRHVNIVRNLNTVTEPGLTGTTELELPADFDKSKFHVLAFVQSTETGEIKNAAKSEIGT